MFSLNLVVESVNKMKNKAVVIYEKLSKVPALDSVSVSSDDSHDDLHWQARWSHRDVIRQSKINFTSTGSLAIKDGMLASVKSPFISEITTEKIVSASHNFKAYLQEIEIKYEKHYFLEIWKNSQKVSSVDLTKENKHGKVHSNSVFGCLNWSNSNDKLLYVAEKKITKSKSYFEKSKQGDDVGNEFIHREDWGEQLVGCYYPTLFMYDVTSGEITDLSEYLPNDASVSCAVWSKDDKSLYILAWKASPWKLGLGFCKNRYSLLYKLDVQSKKVSNLTDGKSCVFSPLVTPDGSQLLYLETQALGPHRQCCKLLSIDLKNDTEQSHKVVVDIVNQQCASSRFQGLFIDKLIDNCWLMNQQQLIVTSLHRSHKALLCIDVDSGKIVVLESVGTWNILHVKKDVLFVSFSTPNTPTVFKVGKYSTDKMEWHDVDAPVSKLDNIAWEVFEHKPLKPNPDFPGLVYESVLVMPSTDAPLKGLIVNPHGGPHSVFCAGFDLFTAGLCQLGFAVLRVNYRGSIGFGQSNVISLAGNIGCQDVCDVQQAAEIVSKNLSIPCGKIMIFGGSHGGFLTLHLAGQYPHFYSAGATRNPVTNILTKTGTNDIMDWCYYEGGLNFNYDRIPTPEDTQKFLQVSPILHVAKVEAPLLFLIGLSDLRVPSSQSFEYIHALRGMGKKVKVLTYPNNNHSIAAVNAEADCFVNIANWFSEHCAKTIKD